MSEIEEIIALSPANVAKLGVLGCGRSAVYL